jgi:ABC-type transport system involved in multi-copper enzyme maturation permease subunit
MWTLIRREFEDVFASMLLTLIMVILGIIIEISVILSNKGVEDKGFQYGVFIVVAFIYFMIIFPLMFCIHGADQIARDRTRKVSAFLCTLATTRSRIFAAKLIVGLIHILAMFIPFAVINMFFADWLAEPFFDVSTFWHRLLAMLFFVSVTAYCLGIMFGERVTPPILHVLFAFIVCFVLAGLVFIKGPSPATDFFLLVMSVGAVAYSRRQFLNNPL